MTTSIRGFFGLMAVCALTSVTTDAGATKVPDTTPAATALQTNEAETLWNQVGCVSCHGEDGYYRDKIKGALGKPTDAVARWIRNAPSIKPDTVMPNFETVLTDAQSRSLAEWVLKRAAPLP